MRSVVFVLMWVGACRGQPALVAPPAAPSPPAPALKQPVATMFGAITDGAYKRQSRFDLSDEATFGWRIKLPCTGPTLFRETLQLPGAREWALEPPLSKLVQVSADERRAVTEDYSGCYDGWIQHSWTSQPNDPPGEYVLTVEVEGYQPQTFRARFVLPENARLLRHRLFGALSEN